jgi:hypothetical protein
LGGRCTGSTKNRTGEHKGLVLSSLGIWKVGTAIGESLKVRLSVVKLTHFGVIIKMAASFSAEYSAISNFPNNRLIQGSRWA